MTEINKLVDTIKNFLLEKKDLSLESAYFVTKMVNEQLWLELSDLDQGDDEDLLEEEDNDQEQEEDGDEPEEEYDEEDESTEEDDPEESFEQMEDLEEEDVEVVEPKLVKKRPGGKPKQPGNPKGKSILKKPKLTLKK